MAQFTIEISDDKVTIMDKYLKSLIGNPEPDGQGNMISRPQFSNGVSDWLAFIIGKNMLNMPCIMQISDISAEQAAIIAAEERKLSIIKPVVSKSKT